MHLSWIQYQVGQKSQYHLALMVLEQEDRFTCLLSDEVPKDEAELIRRNAPLLDQMAPGDKVRWFRENITSYSKAYREFRKDRATIASTFELSPLKSPSK